MTQNGPVSKIYHLKPVFELPEKLEPCITMYKIRNLHEKPGAIINADNQNMDKNTTHQENISDEDKIISLVLKRQEELIKHLNNVQSKVADLKTEIAGNISKQLTTSSELSKENVKSKVKDKKITTNKKQKMNCTSDKPDEVDWDKIFIRDMVINVTPQRPAYSLLTLPLIWEQKFTADYLLHTHSTVNEIPDCFKNIKGRNIKNKDQIYSIFNIRLIWKDVPDTEIITSPFKSTPILGEVNLLRLMYSMLSADSNDDSILQIQLDSALDTCHQLIHTTHKHESALLIKKLNDYLGSNDWMLGADSMSIVDGAAWSAIQISTRSNQLSQNMTKWFNKINTLVGITTAAK